jgi:hypothetical protein
LGVPAQEFVAHLQPKSALAVVELFARFADSDAPIAVLGYAYALERRALFSTEESVAAIERLIPAGIKATRCLRVHSAIGSDAGHVAESIAFMAALPPKDRGAIAHATYETISLRCAAPRDYPGDEAMRALLAQFGWAMAEMASAKTKTKTKTKTRLSPTENSCTRHSAKESSCTLW